MKHPVIASFSVLLAAPLFLVGCQAVSRPNVPPAIRQAENLGGRLTIRINPGTGERSVQAKVGDIDRLMVSVSVPGMFDYLKKDLSQADLNQANSLAFPEMPVGTATVSATAFNSLGMIIGSDQVEAEIEAGENREVELTLHLMPDYAFNLGCDFPRWETDDSLFFSPHGIAFDPTDDHIAYMTNTLDHGILKVDNGVDEQLSQWSHNGKGTGNSDDDANKRFVFPSALKIDRKGNIYVLDDNRGRAFSAGDDFGHRIRKISKADGSVTTVFLLPSPTGQEAADFLADLRDIALDPAGNLYFLKYRRENGVESAEIIRVNAEGPATSLIVLDNSLGYRMAADGKGFIYLTRLDMRRNVRELLKIDKANPSLQGAVLAEGDFRALCLDERDNLYAYCQDDRHIHRFGDEGAGYSDGKLANELRSIAIDENSGNLLAVSPGFNGILGIK